MKDQYGYGRDQRGPYHSPPEPAPRRSTPPRWARVLAWVAAPAAVATGAVVAVLAAGGTAQTVAGATQPTYDPGLYTPETKPTPTPTPKRPAARIDRSCVTTRVVDGDTLDVACAAGKFRVRVIGVNTPEVYGKRQCYGPEASKVAAELLGGGANPYSPVTLISDPTQADKDRYGRLLRYVEVDPLNPAFVGGPWDLGLWLIEQGAAREYTYDHLYERRAQYKQAEAKARDLSNGLWGACDR